MSSLVSILKTGWGRLFIAGGAIALGYDLVAPFWTVSPQNGGPNIRVLSGYAFLPWFASCVLIVLPAACVRSLRKREMHGGVAGGVCVAALFLFLVIGAVVSGAAMKGGGLALIVGTVIAWRLLAWPDERIHRKAEPYERVDSPSKQNQSSGSKYRLTPDGWITSAGLILLLGIFLFPPWLGVEQLSGGQDTVRAVGRRIIFSSPSPEFVMTALHFHHGRNILTPEHAKALIDGFDSIPESDKPKAAQLLKDYAAKRAEQGLGAFQTPPGVSRELGRYYFAKIDYARWWTEIFVCLAAAGAAMVIIRSLRPVQRG